MEANLNTPIEDLCRDDRCKLISLHYKHPISTRFNHDLFTCQRYNFPIKVPIIQEMILKSIGSRECLPGVEIYHRVENDYGSVSRERIYYNLKKMTKAKILSRVRCRHIYGYCHADNPHLKDDIFSLQERVEEHLGGL